MPAIPNEIWLYIAQFVPPVVLQDLLSLNSTFFDIAMDCRYRQMSFAYLDNRMIRNLARLKDPAVAKRVRILHLYPGFIKDFLENRDESNLRRSLRARLVELAFCFLEQKLFPKWYTRFRIVNMLHRTEDVVKIMLEVLSGLPNVTDYYVTWCGLPSITATAVPFLSAVFQSNLRKLSLELSLENVKNILTPSFQIQNLEELQLCIHTKNVDVQERLDILCHHLAPAISRLHATLHTLTVQSWEPTDLAPMFYSIQRLPVLQEVTVSIPIQPTHLGDPGGFAYFLNTHSCSLRTLRLRANQNSGAGLTPDPISFDMWIREAICHVRLPKLRTLDISSTLFPLATAEACVSRFGSSIRTLALTGTYRTYGSVEDLLDIILARQSELGHDAPLERLRLNVNCLSPQLVNLFASKLPRLQRLDLIIKYLVPHALDHVQWHKFPSCGGQKVAQIDDFVDSMQMVVFPTWQLRYMSVLAEGLPSRAQYEPILEQTFLYCIPSLKAFT